MIKRLKFIHLSAWAMLAVMVSFMLSFALKLPEPIVWGIRIGILTILYSNLKSTFNKKYIDKKAYILVLSFITWQLIGFARACYYANGYWMWKSVVTQLLITLFYIVILVSVNLKIVSDYLKLYWLFCIPLALLSLVSYHSIQQLNYMPYVFLLLCSVFIPITYRLLLLALLSLFFVSFEHRNDMGKLLVAISIGIFVTYFYSAISVKIIKVGRFVLLLAPIFLLSLGVSGIFNPFKMEEYLRGDYTFSVTSINGTEKRDFKADTRTFIYKNVFYTLNKYDDLLVGRSPAFGDEGGTFEDNLMTGLKGRYGNEVGIMDIFLWYGLIGAILYFLIFVRASYLAVYRSRNRIAKGIGLYVTFLWVMSFIWEKPLLETFFMTDLIMLGFCLSKPFRYMTDNEIKLWVKSIFVKRINIKKKDHETAMDFKRAVSRNV